MAKVLDPTWQQVELETTDGGYPLHLTIFTRWNEAGVDYVYWATAQLEEEDVIATETTALMATMAADANP